MKYSKKSGNSKVKDLSLAKSGAKNVAWAKDHMKALAQVKKKFEREKPLKDLFVGMALHITKETAFLIETLQAGGAKVAIAGCNPLSTQDDVAAYLANTNAIVYGWKGETTAEYWKNLESVVGQLKAAVDAGFKIATIDDGCDLVSLIHEKYTKLLDHLVVGTEETTTGVIRLRAMEKSGALKCPVIAVNDNKTKHLFDNYYGTGQSTIDGIIRATSTMIAGSKFVVAGYGPCGEGLSKCARGLGAIVSVTEVDPIRALQARMDGFEVVKMSEAATYGDIFVTVTGDINVITLKHIKKMKTGTILANSGHFDVEIDVRNLYKQAKSVEQIRPGLQKINMIGEHFIYLCGEGRLVNLACAEGHPSVVMSLSFCGQALAIEYGIKNAEKLENKVHVLPGKIDNHIATLQLEAIGIGIDKLTAEQEKYLASWQSGT
ncbi:adenosylhomocysteinase [Candidatus Berkelbacteria bacterium CG10_big_fil_rev_8_21_14_0_10_41_12]|uniref:Adenosylhomocysteinase n=1 Tax=Candidatus Berkelbacteria bacterium CG10_big_fil_rev_8_21_14_0_10_41_12 TaxID=1974513 RepID=A0A2M6WWJ7_9BACT|nr:MAG: adenosylhomocysteinase [Candidatus Berkelbacteria bacterium CG10_big_fil_rev_8_21_14_0_10_41_12]